MSRRPTSFRQQTRPPSLRSFSGTGEQDKERRAAYVAVGLVAAATQFVLAVSSLTAGRFALPNAVGTLLALGLSAACYKDWVPIRSINMLVAYGNSLWIGGNLLALLGGVVTFDRSMFIISSIAVFIAMSWLPVRQAVPIALTLTGLLILVVMQEASQDKDLLTWTLYLNILFVFMTYYGQRINDARLREEMLERLASTDPLTSVLNRRGGWHHLEQLMQGQQGAVILADVDNFKKINDQHGHAVGDEVLKAIAGTLTGLPTGAATTEAKATEPLTTGTAAPRLVARWGGEEFLIVLPGAGRPEAEHIAEQILQDMRQLHISGVRPVTLSLGVATIQETTDPDHLIALADQRMYSAKQAGGNAWHAE